MAAGVLPPADFVNLPLVTTIEPSGRIWRRLYASKYPNPLGIGPGLSRFSDPTGRAYDVLYLGASVKVAFIEVVLRDRGQGYIAPVPIPYRELESYTGAEIEIARDLRLVDLCGDSGLRMGVPTDVVGASDQTLSRHWSKAFHMHPENVDGIFYPSRLNEERNIALYDRSVSKLHPIATPRLVDCRDALAKIIRDLALAIV